MIAIRGLIFSLFLLASHLSWSQASEKFKGEYANFYRAEELFEKEQYSAAREVFSEFIQNFKDKEDPFYIKAKYYEGISALGIYNGDALKLLLDFNNEYPESIYKNNIYFKIGEHFYQQKKYRDAKEWLDKTDPFQLDTMNLSAYHFKLGYANFQLENYTEARNEFYEIKEGNSNYSQPALYYYSHIAYKNEAYQEALDGFLKLEEVPAFQKEVIYYIVQIYYLMGNYEEVTKLAPEYTDIDGGIDENTADMNLLIGDAYYRVRKYDEAVAYLENYNRRKETTREQDYALGFAYFQSKQFDNSIKSFDRVTKEKDLLAQTSFYHIAQAYLEKKEPNYARGAFRSASELNFDTKIQEDALYNYAVLSHELDYDPYNESIKAFELYLNAFPNSEKRDNVYNYLVNVYSSTKNYEEAIKSLDRIANKNIKLKTAYQIASYNRGIEQYERGDYKACITIMETVPKYDIDPLITAKAKFWKADAYFTLQEWNNAIKEYKAFLIVPGMNDLELKEDAYYNIAYAYFMQKDWTQAIQAFRTFTQLNNIQNQDKLADAYERLGDCYYTKPNPDFANSALNYESSLQYGSRQKDRALYSLSNVYQLIPGKREQQIASLNKLLRDYPNSSYKVIALFDIAQGYKNEGKYDLAEQNFKDIEKNFPNNILIKDALIEIADIKFKQKKYEESESYFRRVLREYSLDDETCKKVTKGIIDVYRATRKQDKIISLGKEFACAEITEDDQEVFFYETASELYVNDKYEEAIPEINKYLEHYPNGRFSVQLLSYLGDIYYQKGEQDNTIKYYEKVIEKPNSAYTEEALIRTSKLLYNTEEYEKALPHYQKLEKLSSNSQVIFNTRVGLMRTNFLLENYADAADAAFKVIEDKLLEDKKTETEANYIAGKSFFLTEKLEQAPNYLRWTADNTGEERGTEALYILAEIYYKLGNYKESEKLHNELMKRKPAYDYWIGKSLILQAKTFMVTDNLFQAEQTINLVIANYPNKEDGILNEAGITKAEILQLKNTPDEYEDNLNRMIDINDKDND